MRFPLLPVPHEPGTRADERIVPDLTWIRNNFRVDLRDAYAATGHAAGGEHPLGLGVDILPDPSRRGTWDDVDRLAKFAAQHPGVFRFVGYDGRFGTTAWPGHGRGKHLHLSWRHSNTTLGAAGRVPTLRDRGVRVSRPTGPAEWLKQAGWPSSEIPVMVAIGGAESHWKVDAVGGPNSDGSYDYGWLQINSIHGYDRERLLSDPIYTARAGRTIRRQQGFKAWSVFNSGAYKAFMGQKPNVTWGGRSRPGGEEPGSGGDPNAELVSFWDGVGSINPLDLFKGAGKSIGDIADFFKWIAWIFHPLNLLRAVEFTVGFPLIVLGIAIMVKVWEGGSGEQPVKFTGRVTRRVVARTPAGRAARVVRGRQVGRQRARARVRVAQTRGAVRQGERSVSRGNERVREG